jgi:signal transduction histidine kinase
MEIRNAVEILDRSQYTVSNDNLPKVLLTLKKEKINLVDEMANLIKEFTDRAKERNVKLKFVFDEDQTFYVYGHRTKLYQVFINLIANCLKFTKDGSINISLARYSSNTIDKKSYATLSIRDTGPGIGSEILPRLFGRSSKSPNGIGSMLFISKHILNVHGGTISAYNNADNKGATFVVTLPLPDAQESDDKKHFRERDP